MTLVQASEGHFEALLALFTSGNAELAQAEPFLPQAPVSREAFRDQLTAEFEDSDHHHLAAERDGRCVGWGHASVVSPPEGDRFGYVSAVYVAREARRRGVGTALVMELVTWLEAQDVSRIELVTPSRSEARELWRKLGFRPVLETLVLDTTSDPGP